MTETTAQISPSAIPPTITGAALPARPPRFDIYGFIHKALRQAMAHTLRGLGRLDTNDELESKAALDEVDALLALLRSHVQHENDFVHTAIEARQPGAARMLADDHGQHQEALHNLEDESSALRHAPAEQRALLAQRLYRHLAAFVGENLVHMQVEEARGNATLWALYSDEELMALHDSLVASIGPSEMAEVTRWMARALSVPELVALFSDMRLKAPPPAFEALLDIASSQLEQHRWAQLARALGLPPVPGLMTAA